MLSRDEITSSLLPRLIDREFNKNSCLTNQLNNINNDNNNQMHKSKNKSRNIRFNVPAQSSFISLNKQGGELKTSATNSMLVKMNTENNIISKRQLKLLDRYQSKEYKEHNNKCKEIKRKLSKFYNEKVNHYEGPTAFNLKSLINKVKSITRSVKLDSKFHNDIPMKYRLHSISKKKDSKQVEEYLRQEKSLENLSLQKLILDVEYDNVVNKRKKEVNSQQMKVSHFQYRNTLGHQKTNIKAYTINNTSSYHNTDANPYNTTPKRYEKKKTILLSLPKNSLRRGTILLTEIDDQYQKNRFQIDQDHFIEKYKKCFSDIEKEEKKHLNKKVFTRNEINSIMKSKKDIMLDSLKSEYVKEFNEKLTIKKEINKRNRINDLNNLLGIKDSNKHRIGKKVAQALTDSDEGNMKSIKYKIKDYFTDLHYQF